MRYPYVGGEPAPDQAPADLRYQAPLPKFNPGISYFKGEVPYESPEPDTENPLNVIRSLIKKIGPARMHGILSAVAAPVPEGQSSFNVGLSSYMGGQQAYEDRLRSLGAASQKELLEERKVQAQETQAEAAKNRAASYDIWARSRGQTGITQGIKDKISTYMGLPSDQRQAGFDMGLFHRPRPSSATNEAQRAAAIKELSGGRMTDEEARFLTNVKPYLLSTSMVPTYDKTGKNFASISSKREYGVPRMARQILAKYGMELEDLMGLSSSPTADYSEGPDAMEEVQGADNSQLEMWLKLPNLSAVQLAWLQDELEARAQEEEENGAPADSSEYGQ